jgi:hypothetical protein
MRLSDEDLEKLSWEMTEDMSMDDLMQYVYEDLLYSNSRDPEVAVENWFANRRNRGAPHFDW